MFSRPPWKKYRKLISQAMYPSISSTINASMRICQKCSITMLATTAMIMTFAYSIAQPWAICGLKAVIVLKPEAQGQVTAEDIIAWARGELAAYKVPRLISFADSLPRTATNKVDWRGLQDAERARAAGA